MLFIRMHTFYICIFFNKICPYAIEIEYTRMHMERCEIDAQRQNWRAQKPLIEECQTNTMVGCVNSTESSV